MRANIGDCIAERIMNLCQEHNITLNKLGTICGINQSTLNNIVSRTNRCANVATVKKICDGLNMTIVDFFDSDEFRDIPQEIL